MLARFGVRWSLSPMVSSVYSTPGICRMSRATRSAARSVTARLEPSGVRSETWNCASSVAGSSDFCTRFISNGDARERADAGEHDDPAVPHREAQHRHVDALPAGGRKCSRAAPCRAPASSGA